MEKNNSHSHEIFIPLTERLKAIPEVFGIRVNEEPHYHVLKHDGRFEIREYGVQTLARVTLQEEKYDLFLENAFLKLAHYIFSGNSRQENIAMTSPVLIQHGSPKSSDSRMALLSDKEQLQKTRELEKTWTMWFILPKKIDLFTAPSPLDPEVHLEERSPRTVACASYSGNNSLKKIKSNKRSLASWLDEQTDFRENGSYYSAQYDAPFTLPFIKRNEVLVDVIWSH